MSSLPIPTSRPPRVRPKTLLFGFIALMFAYVLWHDERFWLDGADPAWEHYAPMMPWLLPHGLAGVIALLLGAAQFSSRLRARHLAWHRRIGRSYLACVCIAAPLGVLIAWQGGGRGDPPSLVVAGMLDGLLWLAASAMAFMSIRQRRIDAHRRWMTRSYALALVFLEVRFLLGITGAGALGIVAVDIMVWSCVALAIPLADLVLHFAELPPRRAVAPGPAV